MKQEQKDLILNRLSRLIKYDILPDEAVEEIDSIMTRELAKDEEKHEIDTEELSLNPDEEVDAEHGYEREIIDGACESGICPSR